MARSIDLTPGFYRFFDQFQTHRSSPPRCPEVFQGVERPAPVVRRLRWLTEAARELSSLEQCQAWRRWVALFLVVYLMVS